MDELPVLTVPLTVDGKSHPIHVPVAYALSLSQSQVGAFHTKFGLTFNDKPTIPPEDVVRFRMALHKEEVIDELMLAMSEGDMPGIADGIADAIYVLLGTAVTYGIDIGKVFDAVHEANMAKVVTGAPGDTKPTKPPGWQPPDVEGILHAQGWEG